MDLPYIEAPLFYWLNPGAGYVNFQQGTAGVLSVLDVVNGTLTSQTTASKQPLLVTSNSGAGPKSLSFASASSQYLSANAAVAALPNTGFTVCFVAAAATPASAGPFTAVSLGNSGTGALVEMQTASNTVKVVAVKDGGGTTTGATGVMSDTNFHVYSIVWNGSAIVLRKDGTQVSTNSVSGSFTVNQLTIGALNSNGSQSHYYNGSVAQVAVWSGGAAEIARVEQYFMGVAQQLTSPAGTPGY